MIEQLSLEQLTTTVTEKIQINASLEKTFDALLQEMGPHNVLPNGDKMSMKLEAWPGGRWFRDLGNDNGHFWAVVQAIKRPTLLELCGPLFLSAPVMSNMQYRLTPVEDGTLITFRHSAFGFVPAEFRDNVGHGWAAMHERVKRVAETR